MAYTVQECKDMLTKLREASEGLASETLSSATVNGVEYVRTDTDRLMRQIDWWQNELAYAEREAGDYSKSNVRWVG